MFLFELLINQHIFITPNTNMILFNPKLNLRFFPFSALYTIKPTNIKKINSIRKNIYSFIYILLREFSLFIYIMGVNPSNRRLRASKQVKITKQQQKIWSLSRTDLSILNFTSQQGKKVKNSTVYQTHNDKNTDNSTDPGNIIARGYLTKMFDSDNDIKMYFISEKDQVFTRKKNIFFKNDSQRQLSSNFGDTQPHFIINSSLTKVGSRKGSGFGIGNQGGNSLFSFKLNNRIKPHNNWNPLQLNNPNFNSKLYQKNDNHTSFPYSKFCNYRRRQDVPRFMKFFPPNSYNNDFNFPFPIGSRKDLFGDDGAEKKSNIAGMKKPKYDIQYRTKFSKAKNRH